MTAQQKCIDIAMNGLDKNLSKEARKAFEFIFCNLTDCFSRICHDESEDLTSNVLDFEGFSGDVIDEILASRDWVIIADEFYFDHE